MQPEIKNEGITCVCVLDSISSTVSGRIKRIITFVLDSLKQDVYNRYFFFIAASFQSKNTQ